LSYCPTQNLAKVTIVSVTPLYELLTRSGLHQLPSLKSLWIYCPQSNSSSVTPDPLPVVEHQAKVEYAQLRFLFIPHLPHCIFNTKLTRMLPRVETVWLQDRMRKYSCALCQAQTFNCRCVNETQCIGRDIQMIRSFACLPSLREVWHRGNVIPREQLPSWQPKNNYMMHKFFRTF